MLESSNKSCKDQHPNAAIRLRGEWFWRLTPLKSCSFRAMLQQGKPDFIGVRKFKVLLWSKNSLLFFLQILKGASTVISWSFARSVDIVAWPVQRRFAFCTSWKVSEVIQRSTSTRLAFPSTKNNRVEIAHKNSQSIYLRYIPRENWWKSIGSYPPC